MGKTLQLKATRIDVHNTRERSHSLAKSRHKFDSEVLTIQKSVLAVIVHDYELMFKALKKAGLKFDRPLHYNETKEWKDVMKKGVRDKDVPAFLKKGKTHEDKPIKRKRIRI